MKHPLICAQTLFRAFLWTAIDPRVIVDAMWTFPVYFCTTSLVSATLCVADCVRQALDAEVGSAERRSRVQAPQSPLEAEYSLSIRSRRSREDVNQSLAAVARFPDHPDRALLERHRDLQFMPETSVRRVFSTAAALWSITEASSRSDSLLMWAGDQDVCWQDARLPSAARSVVIIAAGRPYAAGYSIGRMQMSAQETIGLLSADFLNLPPVGWARRSSVCERDRVTLTYASSVVGSATMEVNVEAKTGNVLQIKYQNASELSIIRYLYEGGSSDSSLDLPTSVDLDRSDGTSEQYIIYRWSSLSDQELQNRVAIPSVENPDSVVDFRTDPTGGGRYKQISPFVWNPVETAKTLAKASLPDDSQRSSGVKTLSPVFRWALIIGGLFGVTASVIVAIRILRRHFGYGARSV